LCINQNNSEEKKQKQTKSHIDKGTKICSKIFDLTILLSNFKHLVVIMKILVAPTHCTPSVAVNSTDDLFLFEGYSLPENPFEFYQGVIVTLCNAINKTNSNTITLKFNLKYFNTASAKSFLELIKTCREECLTSGKNLKVSWNIGKDDEDVKETVSIITEFFSDLKFEIIEN
jgi:hypothetical protein